MKALVGAFNQEKALVGAFSVIVKTGCGTDGSVCGTRQDRGNSVWKSDSFCTPQPSPASRPPPHRWRERAELIDQEFISDSDSGHCLGTRNAETFIINISWSWHFVIQSATCLIFKPIFAFNILNLLKSWPIFDLTYLILWMRSLINKFNWLVCLLVAACGDI